MNEITGITICRNCNAVFNGIAKFDKKKRAPVCEKCGGSKIIIASSSEIPRWLASDELLEKAMKTMFWFDIMEELEDELDG